MNLSVSAAAVQSAMERFSEAAVKVSQGPISPGFAANVVDLKVAERQVEAAVQLVRTESDILGYLIDELV
jgi:hypothetical protein